MGKNENIYIMECLDGWRPLPGYKGRSKNNLVHLRCVCSDFKRENELEG